MSQTEKCAHPDCHCPANSDNGYCSEFCAQANDNMDTQTNCSCGHTPCITQTKTPPLHGIQ